MMLRNLQIWKLLSAIGVTIFVAHFLFWNFYWPQTKNFSRSPQEHMAKLTTAIKQGDEQKTYALFYSREGYEKFMNVRFYTELETNPEQALVRRKGQSALSAWQQWFGRYGAKNLQCESYRDTKHGECWQKNLGFIFVLDPASHGYLIQKCVYLVT